MGVGRRQLAYRRATPRYDKVVVREERDLPGVAQPVVVGEAGIVASPREGLSGGGGRTSWPWGRSEGYGIEHDGDGDGDQEGTGD